MDDPHYRLVRTSLVILSTLGMTDAVRSQAPGTVFPGPTDSADYAKIANKVIDASKDALDEVGKLDELNKAALDYSAKQLKNLNDARARAEEIATNPQNAGLPDVPSESEAKIAPRDLAFVQKLNKVNPSFCEAGSILICNGEPKAYSDIECSIAIPDPSMPTGKRNISVVDVQCVPEGGRLVGHIVGVLGDEHFNGYKGSHLSQEGNYILYNGFNYAAFCVPCTSIRKGPFGTNCPSGRSFFGICLR